MLLPRYLFNNEFTRHEKAFRECGGEERLFSAGEFMCHPSKMLYDSYYIISGISKLSLLTDNAKELVIAFYGEGSIFPLITSQQEFTLEPHILLTATTKTKALAIPPQGMRMMTEKYPDFSVAAIDHYCRFSNLMLVRNILSSENASYQKVCNFLYLYWHYQPNIMDAIPFTQEEIASITGLTRVQIARVMARMRSKGIIDNSRRKVKILDLEALKNDCLSLVKP